MFYLWRVTLRTPKSQSDFLLDVYAQDKVAAESKARHAAAEIDSCELENVQVTGSERLSEYNDIPVSC